MTLMRHPSWLMIVIALALMSLLPVQPALAASITVNSTNMAEADDGECTLIEAIIAANTDTESGLAAGECPAGSGADTIILTATTYRLTTVNNSVDGDNGLPSIISNITILGNGATIERDSGAPQFRIFYMSAAGTLIMDNLIVSGGDANGAVGLPNNGGGLLNQGGTLTITNSTFMNNTANDTGGALQSGLGTAVATITNSTFTANISTNSSTTSNGGNVVNSTAATMTLRNVTIADNIGTGGAFGGIHSNGASMTIHNTIIANNPGGNCTGTITTSSNNLEFPGTACGAGFTSDDPILLAPALNSGLTPSMMPDVGSAAIDGVASGCPPPATDQRGFARPAGALCDIGAVEATTDLDATAACNGNNLEVTIIAGDGPFTITGTGPNIPAGTVGIGLTVINGPGSWTGITVTETSGDTEFINLLDFGCTTAVTLDVNAACNGDDLDITIVDGDGPFNIEWNTGPGTEPTGVGTGVTQIPGPGLWTQVTVRETTGDLQSFPLGDRTCGTLVALNTNAACNGNNLDVNIVAGDGPFEITWASGPGTPPLTGILVGTTTTLTGGPGTWTNVIVRELGGDVEASTPATFTCPTVVNTPLNVNIACNGNNLDVTINAGDGPFTINWASGPGAPPPLTGITAPSTTTLTGGPGTWNDVVVSETTGDVQSSLPTDFNCFVPVALDVNIACNGANLDVTINAGNGPFTIVWASGPGTPPLTGITAPSTTTLTGGPGTWNDVVVSETTGDLQSSTPADFTCTAPSALAVNIACNGSNLDVTINAGDGPFTINWASGPGTPPLTGIAVGSTTTLTGGPGTWNDVVVTETTGNLESSPPADFTCPTNVALNVNLACNGSNLDVTINAGDGPFTINWASGPGTPPLTGIAVGSTTTLTGGPGTWDDVVVTETTGDTQSSPAADFTCPPPVALAVNIACSGNDLAVTINTGDGPFEIDWTSGPGAPPPLTGILVGSTTLLTGPGTWVGVVVRETTGNTEASPAADFTCPTITALNTNIACSGNNLDVTINAGDGPFEIDWTSGPGSAPLTGILVGSTTTLTGGPATWTGVVVRETTGDLQSSPAADFTCPTLTALSTNIACDGDDLDVTINAGDGPFTINWASGPGTPPLTGVTAPSTTTLTGPGTWDDVVVTETTGDLQSSTPADFNCVAPVALNVNIACNGSNLDVTINTGDGPFTINWTGPGTPPLTGITAPSTTTLTGPGTWTGVSVTETTGNLESSTPTDFTCPPPTGLAVTANCNGSNLDVNITAGDGPFTITGTGPGLPGAPVSTGITTLTGPGTWTIAVTETTGDTEATNFTNITCPAPAGLNASAACNGVNLGLNITAGDGPFNITGTGPNLPGAPVGIGITPITGPGTWNITVTETTGDTETVNLPSVTCPALATLAATAACNGVNLRVTITAGDGPFNITGTGTNLPANGVGVGNTTLNAPGPWNGVTVTETTGNTETINLGNFTCTGNTALSANAACNGSNLRVNIVAGDGPFNVTFTTGPGAPLAGVAVGSYNIPGPGTWTSVRVDETAGDVQTLNLGSFTCPSAASVALNASVSCNGSNLQVVINAGDGPFNILGTGPGLPNNGVGIGTTTYGGPATWDDVRVRETTGNQQTVNFSDFTCGSSSGSPTATPVPAGTPGPTATPIPLPGLCADVDGSTNNVIRADAAAGTVTGGEVYCRVIYQNGQVITNSAEIGIRAVIDLGIIHAVDVFGLRPNNESAPDFNNSVTVCLQGSGSMVYLNALQAPRIAVVLTGTSSSGGYTCGNIPDAGTVILTTSGGDLPTTGSAPGSGGGGGGPTTNLSDCHVTTWRRVNLRSGPALDTSVILVLQQGITMPATGRRGRWYHVNYNGTTGWVRAGYVTPFGSCS